jgi:predicted nucleotidyltransferase
VSLRQEDVLRGIVERASTIDAIDGVVLIGSFARGNPDPFSDLDLVVAASPGRLDDAWRGRRALAGDVLLLWDAPSDEGEEIRWANWLTHDLVKVECGIAAPGAKELAEPFRLVGGQASVLDRFPALTAEERLGWALAELKAAARELLRRGAQPAGWSSS